MFQHYLLNEEESSLVNNFYKLQSRKSVKNDWSLTVKQNLETLEIALSEEQIKSMSEPAYKKIVNSAIKKEALNYLNGIKSSHSKVLHIEHAKLEMQDYLLPSSIPADLAKFTFQCRSRMLNVGANFKEGGRILFPTCPVCKIPAEYDSQQHLMMCHSLNTNILTGQKLPNYDELFGKNLEKRMIVVDILKANFHKRNKVIKENEEN